MIRLSQRGLERLKTEKEYNGVIFWCLGEGNQIDERIRTIAHINPYLALLCCEKYMYGDNLKSYINDCCSRKMCGEIKSTKQVVSIFLVKAKLGEVDIAYDFLVRNGRKMSKYSVIMAVEQISGEGKCIEIMPVLCCALLKISPSLFDIAIEEIIKLDLHLYKTEMNEKYFHSCCGYLVQRKRFSLLDLFLGVNNTLEYYFGLRENYKGFSALQYSTEDEFIEMTRKYKLQSCIYLLERYINVRIGKPAHYDYSFVPKDTVASEAEIKYLHSLLADYHNYLTKE